MDPGHHSRSLGPRELALLEAWEADRARVVSLDDIERDMGEGTSRGAARMMASRLRRKGFLSPLGRGIFAVLPISALGVEAPDVGAYLDGLRLRGMEFYVGFDTAAGHFGWYPEAYGRVTIGVPPMTRRSLSSIDGTYVRVVQVSSEVFVDGVVRETWHGVRLAISTREQTVLDVVRKVDLVDGFSGCLGVLKLAAGDSKLNRAKLAELAARRSSVRRRKRLGWLTERAGWTWSPEELDLLRQDWPASHRATLGDSHMSGGAGRWDNRWKLVVNVPEQELVPPLGVR